MVNKASYHTPESKQTGYLEVSCQNQETENPLGEVSLKHTHQIYSCILNLTVLLKNSVETRITSPTTDNYYCIHCRYIYTLHTYMACLFLIHSSSMCQERVMKY